MKSSEIIEAIPLPDPLQEWNQLEVVADVAKLLECCENSEMLADLRQCDIPSEVFKAAAQQLPREKRDQIRQWVVQQNIASGPSAPSNESLLPHKYEVGQRVTVTRDNHPDKGKRLEVTQVGDGYIYCLIVSGKKQGEQRIYTADEIAPWGKGNQRPFLTLQ